MNRAGHGSRSTERQWRRNRRVVLVVAVLVFGGFTLVMPFLPLYLRELGITEVASNALWSGVLIAISPLLSAFVGPLWGSLADRYGLKPMVLRATAGLAVSWIFFALSTQLHHLILARIIGGLFGGYNSLLVPLITAECPPEKVSRAVGSVQSARIASLASGPMFGGLLADGFGVRSTAAFTAGFACASLLLFFFFYHISSSGPEAEGSVRPLKLSALLGERYLLPLATMLFLTNFFERGLSPIIALLVLELGTPPAEAAWTSGLIFTGGALASTFSSWWLGGAAGRWSVLWLLRVMAALAALICVPLTFCSSNLELGIYRVLLGLMAGGLLTTVYLLGASSIPAHSRASGMAVLTSGALLGNALGPLAIGFLSSFGLRIALSVGAPVFLVLLWVSWRFVHPVTPAGGGASARLAVPPEKS